MKMKRMFGVTLIAVYLIAGCAANPMVSVYDNDQKIASEEDAIVGVFCNSI